MSASRSAVPAAAAYEEEKLLSPKHSNRSTFSHETHAEHQENQWQNDPAHISGLLVSEDEGDGMNENDDADEEDEILGRDVDYQTVDTPKAGSVISTPIRTHPSTAAQIHAQTARNPRHRPQDVLPQSKSAARDDADELTCLESWVGRGSAVLWLFTTCQILIFFDRGMVAGFLPAVQADVGELSDTEAGLLGSGFIFGYMLACPLFAFFSKQFSPYKLMSLGLFLWCNATLLCGLTNTFYILLAARILTGVGEASFAGLAPTCIDDVAPVAHRTIWLSFFFSGIPLGSALGYVSGGYFDKLGWHYGFMLESLMMLPLVAVVYFWKNPEELDDEEAIARAREEVARRNLRRTNSWARIPRPDFGQSTNYGAIPAQQPASLGDASGHFARSISTPALKRLEDGSIGVLPPATEIPSPYPNDDEDESTTGGGGESGGEVKQSTSVPPPTLVTTIPGPPGARRPSRTRTPKAMERRYIIPDRTNPFHAPGTSASTAAANAYQEATFTHVQPIHPQPFSPDAHLPSPSSYNPHYEAAGPHATNREDLFLNDVVTLLTDGVYIVVVLGYAALAFVIGALSFWGPVDFSHTLHIGLGRSTRMIGLITFCCGLGGTFFGGWCLDYRGGAKGIFAVISALEICCVFTTISIGFALASVMAVELTTSMICLALADFFLFATGAPVNASLLSVAPKNMRSLAMAMSILLMHALGDLPSPFLMGLITDYVGSIRLALMCLILWLLWTVLFWSIGVRLSRARAEAFKQQLASDMQLPVSERSKLLQRRGSTGALYAQNPEFYDALQTRPSQHRPYQYFDTNENVTQPYPQAAYQQPNDQPFGVAPKGRLVRQSLSHDRTPPHRTRPLFQQRPQFSNDRSSHSPNLVVPGVPIYSASGAIVGYTQVADPINAALPPPPPTTEEHKLAHAAVNVQGYLQPQLSQATTESKQTV